MSAPTPILMDIDQHAALPFPQSLPEFQRLFPDDAACAEYLEKARWGDGFVYPRCSVTREPFSIATRPGVLACRKCRRQTGLTVGTVMERSQHAGLPFPRSLREFQRLFPGDAACAEYLEKVRWGDGFVCPHCGVTGEPFRISTRPGVLACRNCRRQTGLTVGTVMERSHTPLSTWFW